MLIDFHSHVYPKVYLRALQARRTAPYYRQEGDRGVMHHKEFSMTVIPDFYDPSLQLKRMKQDGIDMKVVSLANPWVDCFSPKDAVELANEVNIAIVDMVSTAKGSLLGICTLPMKDPISSKKMLRRAVKDYGFRGAIIGTHISGSRIDERKYWPIYEEAEKLGVPIFVHPIPPPNDMGAERYLLSPAIAFPVETTVTTMRIIYSGLLSKYPNLKIFIPHLGGVLPYLIGRIEKAYELSSEARKAIPKSPSYYLRRNFYSDTIVFDRHALECGLALFDSKHLLFGTDYPFALGVEAGRSMELLKSVHLEHETMEGIRNKNALKLLKLN